MTYVDPWAEYRSGSTEPWTIDVLCTLIRALRPQYMLELGSYIGKGTEKMAEAAPDAKFITVEFDPERVQTTRERVERFPNVTVVQGDTIQFLESYYGPRFDFVFVDDDHSHEHVDRELELVLQLTHKGSSMICVHDVIGRHNLRQEVEKHGGWVLRLPLLHLGGGLGILQP